MECLGCMVTLLLLLTRHRRLSKDPHNLYMRTPCPPIDILGSGLIVTSVISCLPRQSFVHNVYLFVCSYSIFLILPSLSSPLRCDIFCVSFSLSLLFHCSPSHCHCQDVMLCFLFVPSCFASILVCRCLLFFSDTDDS